MSMTIPQTIDHPLLPPLVVALFIFKGKSQLLTQFNAKEYGLRSESVCEIRHGCEFGGSGAEL
jgi:hypothetical protein